MASWTDFTPGALFDLGTLVLSADEIKAFAAVYDPQPFHLDEEVAKKSMLGVLAASGWHTLTLTKKRMVETMLDTPAYGGALNYGDVKWKRPFAADKPHTLSVEVSAREDTSPFPDYGSVHFVGHLVDADGTPSLIFEMAVAIKREAA